MGEVIDFPSPNAPIPFHPVLHFPHLVIWHNGDTHNTLRGNWFFRDSDGTLHGPFWTRNEARDQMVELATGCGVPMRTPFERDGMWWWKKDTPEGPKVMGPITTQTLCELHIRNHVQALKDQATSDYR